MSRIALITGGGSGIGRGIALALARRGVDLVLVGRRVERVNAVAHEAEALGVRATALSCDLAHATERVALFEQVHTSFGAIDILVNNAGVMAGGALADRDGQTIEHAVALNLAAPMHLTQLFLPDITQRRGAVVLVGSMASMLPLPFASLYTATKSGLHGFAGSLRYELEPLGVRLLVAYPPATATAMTDGMAQAAGVPTRFVALSSPEAVGEQIVVALAAGKRELVWPGGEAALARLYAWAPWLVRALFRRERARFAQAMKP